MNVGRISDTIISLTNEDGRILLTVDLADKMASDVTGRIFPIDDIPGDISLYDDISDYIKNIKFDYTIYKYEPDQLELFDTKQIRPVCEHCGKEHATYYKIDGMFFCADCFFEKKFHKCDDCGKFLHNEDDLHDIDGHTICESCLDDNYSYCEHCETYRAIDDMTCVHDGRNELYYCQACADRYATRCDDCGDYFTNDYIYTDSSGHAYCGNCINDYVTCETCEEFISGDNAEYIDDHAYCASCAVEQRPNNARIARHDFKPAPEFQGIGPLYFGLELETDKGDDRSAMVLELAEKFSEKFCYYPKEDGSLYNGVEFVTHPYSYDAIYASKDIFREFCNTIIAHGFTSHNAGTCGLHIHVSRDGLGNDKNLTIGNMLYLFEKYFLQFLKFSRRTEGQLRQWAARYCESEPIPPPKQLKNYADTSGRYHAINTQNYNTVEFRFFRGTLNIDTIYASIQLVKNLIEICKDNEDIMSITFDHLIYLHSECSELIAYAEKRGL